MKRSGLSALALVALASVASPAVAMDFGQHMGYGYGPGYNAPAPPPGFPGARGQHCGACTYGYAFGCCEYPMQWRLNVWNGYRGDPFTDWVTRHSTGTPNGYAFGGNPYQLGCPNCAPSGSPTLAPPTAIPDEGLMPQPIVPPESASAATAAPRR